MPPPSLPLRTSPAATTGTWDKAVEAYQNARECLEAAVVRDDLAIAQVELQLGTAMAKEGEGVLSRAQVGAVV